MLKQKASSQDLPTEDMLMTSSLDRYRNRPIDATFNNMSMVAFVSENCVLSKNWTSVNRIKLDND